MKCSLNNAQSSSLLISDLSIAQPHEAVCATPAQDRWLLIPYEGAEISGKMLWSPSRHRSPEVRIPLPAIGRCRIHLGVYGSGTWPWWFNMFCRYGQHKDYIRLRVRLEGDDFNDLVIPEDYPDEQRLGYISQTLWRTADLKGQSLILGRETQEAFMESMAFLAYVKLEPTDEVVTWPVATKKVVHYYDSNFMCHYVDSAQQVRDLILPWRDSDVGTILWTACREDNCYYPSKVGNPLPPDTPTGVYPYWAGRDLHRMLDAGDDPLEVVCQNARSCGMKVFASYRRMTCRMPPFVFPLNPKAMMVNRRDLWCAAADGSPIPHLSMAQPEVRKRMIDLFVELATNYDIDGVHMYFSRSVPFVQYEKPFLEAFRDEHGGDARQAAWDDPRIWRTRCRMVTEYFALLRTALDEVGARRGRRLEIALHAQDSVRSCAYYGFDIPELFRRGLVDLFLPDNGHFLPPEMGGPRSPTPEDVAQFAQLARPHGVRIAPHAAGQYSKDGLSLPQRAKAFFQAGATGVEAGTNIGHKVAFATHRRLGHVDQLDQLYDHKHPAKIVRFHSCAGMTIDLNSGITTCG